MFHRHLTLWGRRSLPTGSWGTWSAAHWQGCCKTSLCWQGLDSQSYSFSSSHVWIWELDHKEGWELKNWCFWTGVLEKTLEHSMDTKEVKRVNPKTNQHWIFIGCWSWSPSILAIWCEELTQWKRPWCWERLKAGEGGERGQDSWMA